MALPITGPFRKVWEEKGRPNQYGFRPVWKSSDRLWYRQSKPFDRPLPFSFSSSQINWVSDPLIWSVEFTTISGNPYTARYASRVYRTAYGKFQDKARGDASDLLTLFAERGKTADMIADRATKLWKGLRAAKRGNLRELKRHWGSSAKIKRNLRLGGSHVLEYSFGWAPLVGDIVNSVNVLREGSKSSGRISQRNVFSDLESRDYGSQEAKLLWKTEIGVRIGWELSIDHPSIALLDQLGLVNPAATFWELVPWSFVFDYFINTNDVISSMTSLAGCTIKNEWVTTRILDNYSERAMWKSGFSPPYPPRSFQGTSISVTRTTAIPTPSWGLKAPWNLSWSRAATSVALLLQQLK